MCNANVDTWEGVLCIFYFMPFGGALIQSSSRYTDYTYLAWVATVSNELSLYLLFEPYTHIPTIPHWLILLNYLL